MFPCCYLWRDAHGVVIAPGRPHSLTEAEDHHHPAGRRREVKLEGFKVREKGEGVVVEGRGGEEGWRIAIILKGGGGRKEERFMGQKFERILRENRKRK